MIVKILYILILESERRTYLTRECVEGQAKLYLKTQFILNKKFVFQIWLLEHFHSKQQYVDVYVFIMGGSPSDVSEEPVT